MKCDDIMELMQRHLDMDLSDTEEQAMFAHLHDCPGCAGLYDRLKLLSQELAELPKVTPPFSIVDSILPQLEALDGLAKPSITAEPALAKPRIDEVAARREKKGLISWKIASGVAAAGIVLGMFIFNGGIGDSKMKVADELLQPKLKNDAPAAQADAEKNAGATLTPKEISDPAAKMTPEASAAVAGSGDGASAASTVAPSSAPRQAEEVNNGTTTSATAKESLKATDQYGNTSAAGKEIRASAAEPGTRPGLSDSKAEPVPAVGTEQPKESPPLAASQESAAAVQEIGTGDAGKEAESKSGKEAVTPSEEQELVMNDTASPRPNDKPAGKRNTIQGIVPFAAEPDSAVSPALSLDGEFTASLSEQSAGRSVTITDKSGAVIFESETKLVPGDKLRFVGWSENNLFTYTIQSAEGPKKTYMISVSERKETAQ